MVFDILCEILSESQHCKVLSYFRIFVEYLLAKDFHSVLTMCSIQPKNIMQKYIGNEFSYAISIYPASDGSGTT